MVFLKLIMYLIESFFTEHFIRRAQHGEVWTSGMPLFLKKNETFQSNYSHPITNDSVYLKVAFDCELHPY